MNLAWNASKVASCIESLKAYSYKASDWTLSTSCIQTLSRKTCKHSFCSSSTTTAGISPCLQCSVWEVGKSIGGASRRQEGFLCQGFEILLSTGLSYSSTDNNVGSWLVNRSSIILIFSKFIQTPLFEKWYLYNAKSFLGPKFLNWKPN